MQTVLQDPSQQREHQGHEGHGRLVSQSYEKSGAFGSSRANAADGGDAGARPHGGPPLALMVRTGGAIVTKTVDATPRPSDYWVQTDVVLPVQFRDADVAPRRSARRLRLAVLRAAIDDVQRYAHSTSEHGRRRHDEALDWLASDDVTEPFAFENVCAALGLDPGYVRRGLWRLREAEPGRVMPRLWPRRKSAGTPGRRQRRGARRAA